MQADAQYIRWFKDITISDIPTVGGKNASLGEMYQQLAPQGVRVPNGFAITAEAYFDMLKQTGAMDELRTILEPLDADDVDELAKAGAKARDVVYHAQLPEQLKTEILTAYHQLIKQYGEELSVAVRSSATAEDLPDASFAGQQETYLNVRGDEELLEDCRRCFASLFTDRAIHYRADRDFDHFQVGLSICVMKMVRSDLAASGVTFSLDTESGYRDAVFITAAYGLGENVVQGNIEPDEFYVHKPTFEQGYRAVLRRSLGSKKIKMVYADAGSNEKVKNIDVSEADRARYCLTDEDILTLADYAIKIEKHYSAEAGYHKPMDMEWAKDGTDGEIYLVQARPETVASRNDGQILEQFQLREQGEVITAGYAVGARVAVGRARYINDVSHLNQFQAGEVLISDTTTPDWEPVMKIAAAIVTNRGGRTCHAAIIARELGVPAVIGCEDATRTIQDGEMITISCAEGDQGKVYRGELKFDVEKTNVSGLERPKTKIMLNVGNPGMAFAASQLPNDGVGLARLEFIITEYIKAHPMALLYPERVSDPEQRAAVEKLIEGYKDGAEYFVQRLSEGAGTIAAAFYPKPVVIRMSDFKTNEYASLLGGADFEPVEANPMLGFRGAGRYIHPDFVDAFALECKALKRVRDDMGLTNAKFMVPFCRRVEEGRKVIEAMAKNGLKRGENGLEVYVMCEIPNNVILIDQFAEMFDGFSIGSNDLTQLTLGVDRDSEILSDQFDERDEGVKTMIRMAVEGAKRNNRYSGICGQAPSDYPEIAEYLVELGIESMSLNPDTVIKTTQHVLEVEKKLG